MRALRLPLAGTVMLALLGGLSVAAVAQEEADPMAPAAVTGTMVAAEDVSHGTATYEAGVYFWEGTEVRDTYEASDPRLSGEQVLTGNRRRYVPMAVWNDSVILVNEGGRWVGTDMGFWGPTIGCATSAILRGEGGYEGLTAYLVYDCGPDPVTFTGIIVPGELPQAPEPPAE